MSSTLTKSTRQAFGEKLLALGAQHSEIVVLDADLSKSTKSDLFAKKYPERFFEMGISEANMIGVAAGLSFTGKLPFLCSFGCFLTGRYDTIRLSVAYSGANVRLVGTHSGVGIGDDGHSQMGLEDIALMRALPTMGVFQPMDALETEWIMDYLVQKWKGPAYLRLTRQNLPILLSEVLVSEKQKQSYDPLKILKIAESKQDQKTTTQKIKKVICFASGAGVAEAKQACDQIGEKFATSLSLVVYNVATLKPFDETSVQAAVVGADLILTVEDHSVIGGLGTCVAEALSKISNHAPLIKCGVQDLFGESAEGFELYEQHGFSAQKIVKLLTQ